MQVVDRGRRQSVVEAITDELIAVETAEASARAEPQEAMRILDDPLDAIVREAGLRRVGLDRELFRRRLAHERKGERKDQTGRVAPSAPDSGAHRVVRAGYAARSTSTLARAATGRMTASGGNVHAA